MKDNQGISVIHILNMRNRNRSQGETADQSKQIPDRGRPYKETGMTANRKRDKPHVWKKLNRP